MVLKRCVAAVFGAALTGFVPGARAVAIDVLWWTYAHPQSEYRASITTLAGIAHTLPHSGGNSWNLTFFDPASGIPGFGYFDVLVIHSGEAFRTSPPGGPLANPNYSGILGNKQAIQDARGDRTFISGADADFHAVRGDTGNVPDGAGGICSPPVTGADCWDGALGHLVNAVNWAGSGGGMGIVSLVAAEFPGSRWWLDANSFLRDELAGYFSIFGPGTRENSPHIPAAASGFALNAGLTDLGLSDWNHSFHAGFLHTIPGYVPIVDATLPGHENMALAIATAATAAGGIVSDGQIKIIRAGVPLPGTLWLGIAGLAAIACARRALNRPRPRLIPECDYASRNRSRH